MLRTVLLPVDFTEDNALILAFAKGLPSIGVRRVILAHVVEVPGVEGHLIAQRVDEALEAIRAFAPELEAAGLLVEVRVATGDTVEEIGALAIESQVDGVVYGSHAKTVMDQLLAGSVSERLLRDATIPHLVVRFDLLRNQSSPESLLRHFGEKIVLPTDFSLSAARAFTVAIDLPKGVIKHLFLVHAIDPALTGEKLRRASEGAEFQLKNLQAMCSQQGITSSPTTTQEAPIPGILKEIDERRATGVIVGTRGRNAVQEVLLGSVSMTLLRQASCPVLIVP
ncbi:MAG: universal stress protein [Coriobacteriia bacterium]|nr:universal stress protein [Coriobacteriia bacterium]